ncbi:MAG TPA: hypothetical protein PLJ38_12200, partial [bacterium]|nr:hypothetical protein [bacterium]
IKKVFIEKNQTDNSAVKKFIAEYPTNFEIEIIDSFDNLINNFNFEFDNRLGKNIIVFKSNKSNFIKKCPCSANIQSCGYYVMNIIQNCYIGCSYCYLQQYINNNGIIIHPNLENIDNELQILAQKNKIIRLGNGEFSDSLLFDRYTGITETLIKKIINYKNIIFEIKSKLTDIEHLLNIDLPHISKKNIVFAWSMNPQKIIDTEETYASSLNERINAAKKAVANGYSVAFHFDPVIVFEDWQNEYCQVIDLIFSNIPDDKILWISIGAFRCAPELIPIIRKNYPNSRTFLGELIIGIDGKARYIRILREKIFKLLVSKIKSYSKNTFVYLCMEPLELWRAVDCNNPQELNYLITF